MILRFMYVTYFELLCDLGWMLAMENKLLSIFCVYISDQGPPEYTFAVTIQENFSWIVYYRGQLVNIEYCMLLQKMPSNINSGMQYLYLVYSEFICACISHYSNKSNQSYKCSV